MNYSLNKDEMLSKLGLQTKASGAQLAFSALGVFSLGAVIGGGLALLFAPKAGRELRTDLRHKLAEGEDGLNHLLDGKRATASERRAE